VVDCGPVYQTDINGCSGGTIGGTFNLMYNYGFTTETNYPYRATRNTCSMSTQSRVRVG